MLSRPRYKHRSTCTSTTIQLCIIMYNPTTTPQPYSMIRRNVPLYPSFGAGRCRIEVQQCDWPKKANTINTSNSSTYEFIIITRIPKHIVLERMKINNLFLLLLVDRKPTYYCIIVHVYWCNNFSNLNWS